MTHEQLLMKKFCSINSIFIKTFIVDIEKRERIRQSRPGREQSDQVKGERQVQGQTGLGTGNPSGKDLGHKATNNLAVSVCKAGV